MASTLQKVSRTPNVTTAAAFLVTNAPAVLVGWNLVNTGTSNAFLKFYNASAAGNVTVGTTPVVRTLLIPASGTCLLSNEDMFQIGFNVGIVCAVTGAIADSDTSAPAGTCGVEILYSANQ